MQEKDIKCAIINLTHVSIQKYIRRWQEKITQYTPEKTGNGIIKKGGVFRKIEDKEIFKNTLTVLNGTVAWDIAGNRNIYKCIDIDPMTIFKLPAVPDFPEI